ncbi:glycosyltransferase [Sphingomonas sp. CFBP 8760]|uniref:glycosyltransferase n=1 Tax=Sphingomonas sp. CFBP 8760 TaxID=2775282 RepID=UPI0017821AA3|nr:glycosyltransferase family 4 protein [Sphingomonas sp. CFBP 8760]
MTTICIDCRYIGRRYSGIAEVIRGLIDRVPALAPDLRFVLLRSPAHPGPLSTAPNVTERVVPQPANGPATMWWLSRVVDMRGIAVFHAPANIMPAGLHVPCVTTIHDIMWLTNPDWCRTGAQGMVDRLFYGHGIRRAMRSARAIITVSQASADAIIAHDPVAGARTHVALSGVSPRFRPIAPDWIALAALGLSPARRFVLTTGQYAPYKNHEGAIAGFAHAFRDRADIDLVIVQRAGRGSYRLQRLADQLGISDRLRLLTAVSEDILLSLYSAASVFLHPSLCEGFGNPVAEAMACGCPVVTSAVSAMPEVAGGAARLIDPHDPNAIAQALQAVVEDPQVTGAMRAAGLARAADLNWNTVATTTLGVYRQLLVR